jgi:hypothetical protein
MDVNERIKALAEQAHMAFGYSGELYGATDELIERFAELVDAAAVAREHERLKQELEKMLMEMYDKGVADGLNSITTAIRGRTE